jgi:hypothetical protein
MRIEKIVIRTAVVLAMTVPMTFGQAPATSTGPRFLISSSAPVSASTIPDREIIREIDDPHNGDRWLLVRDDSHPGGPGRLLLVSADSIKRRQAASSGSAAQAPIIRAGDRVMVEENTSVAEARLEAVALSPAWPGSLFTVRLTIGGSVLRALAAGPGRAVLQQEAQR